MDAKKQYALWRAQRLPDDLAAELAAMAGNADAIEGAFGAELQFGTAGIRGIMGIGTNRLNDYHRSPHGAGPCRMADLDGAAAALRHRL